MRPSKPQPKTYVEDRQNFVSTRMSLPLFMVSRNRTREDNLDSVHKQFKRYGSHYNRFCQKENRGLQPSAATYSHYRHITGYDRLPAFPYPEKRPLRINRSLTTWRDWQLAPNHYGVPPTPFLSRSGTKGVVFAKLPTNKTLIPTKVRPYHFYEIPAEIDRLFKGENAHKGVFLSNARERRPTARNMVSNLTSCWRNPKDPGPTSHYTKYYELATNIAPIFKAPRPNPHLFNRQSCVPYIRNSLVRRNISFEPGPGRYNLRFSNGCPCPAGKINMPGLQVKIDEQKRLKFRRLAYKPINRKKYCDPEFRHVVGQGHVHLFMMSKADMPKPRSTKKTDKKMAKELSLYADAKYLNMIINPQHFPISLRAQPVPPYTPKIVYNCVARRIVRKQLRNNKKIAFNSGQERFKDAERPMVLTASQLEKIKESLPPERRLVDRPFVVRKSIPSKLMTVPDHMRNAYMPKLRKRLFKFLPVPGARVLVTDSDIRPDIEFDRENPTGLYRTALEVETFFRDSVLEAMEREKEPQVEPDDSEPEDILLMKTNKSVRSMKGSRMSLRSGIPVAPSTLEAGKFIKASVSKALLGDKKEVETVKPQASGPKLLESPSMRVNADKTPSAHPSLAQTPSRHGPSAHTLAPEPAPAETAPAETAPADPAAE